MKKLITLFYFIFTIAATLNAQLLINNNALISVKAGAQLTVKGDIQNNSGTTIINNGTIDLNGDWTNNTGNNVFGTSQGTVIMNGNNQLIKGTDQTDFNSLILQNLSTTLQQNTLTGGVNSIPSGILNLNSSVLDLGSKTLLVNNQSVNAINGVPGYILSEQTDNSSKVAWNIGSDFGNHSIPFGNISGVQIPFSFKLDSGNAGTIIVSTYSTAPNNMPYPIIPVPVTHVLNAAGLDNSTNTVDRFWQLDANGTAKAKLTFTWATGENPANGNVSPRAQRWFDATQGWQLPLPGQQNLSSQSVRVPYDIIPVGTGNPGSFPWTVSLNASPLPIELISFEANATANKKVLCQWETASEINNDYFTIERSTDGEYFEPAGKVKGAGNNTNILNYAFTDENPYPFLSYYRLKQTDFNGEYSWSKIVAVEFKSNNEINFYPNPANNGIYFQGQHDKLYSINIFDAQGKTVLQKQNVSQDFFIDTHKYTEGLYTVQIISASNNENKKLIIKH